MVVRVRLLRNTHNASDGYREKAAPTRDRRVTDDMARRKKIPQRHKMEVWYTYIGEKYKAKCMVPWCKHEITPFNFHIGHNLPHSRNGGTDVDNLRPICAQCNLSMSNKYTIDEWNKSLYAAQPKIKASPCPPKKAHAKTKPRLTWRQWFASWFGYRYH